MKIKKPAPLIGAGFSEIYILSIKHNPAPIDLSTCATTMR